MPTIMPWIHSSLSSLVLFSITIGKRSSFALFYRFLINYHRNKKLSPNIVKDAKLFPNDFFKNEQHGSPDYQSLH